MNPSNYLLSELRHYHVWSVYIYKNVFNNFGVPHSPICLEKRREQHQHKQAWNNKRLVRLNNQGLYVNALDYWLTPIHVHCYWLERQFSQRMIYPLLARNSTTSTSLSTMCYGGGLRLSLIGHGDCYILTSSTHMINQNVRFRHAQLRPTNYRADI